MQIIVIIVGMIVLYTTTFLAISIDKKMRYRAGTTNPMNEPEMGTLILLCILCNIATLPFYFGKTRGGIGVLAGFGLFLVCAGLMWVAQIVTALVLVASGMRP
jgi:hypothetical protein